MVIEKLEKCEDSIGSLDDATDNLAIFAFFIYIGLGLQLGFILF